MIEDRMIALVESCLNPVVLKHAGGSRLSDLG